MLFFTAITNYLQAALVGALAVAAPDVAALEAEDEATEETERRESRLCTMSGDTGTGREWGRVTQTTNPDICIRERIGGEAPLHYPSCHAVARNVLGCSDVVTR